jgi:hypothetical protein
MGYYIHDERLISDFRGLYLVTNAEPGEGSETGTVEMVWTAGIGGRSYELDAVLEREATKDLSFYLECLTKDTDSPAVAIVNDDLEPVRAWEMVDQTRFVSILPIHIECLPQADK